jgi:hypothetical protein
VTRCYVAKKPCGHIVAAFPLSVGGSPKAIAEIVEQLIAAGYNIEQTGEGEVGLVFAITCDCWEDITSNGRVLSSSWPMGASEPVELWL